MEELPQQFLGFLRQLGLVERAIHQLHPAIAGALIELERHVPHPQARVAALLDVALRSAEAAHQEIAQPLLGARKVVRRIHRSEDVVGGHLRVKRPDQPLKALFANLRVDLASVMVPGTARPNRSVRCQTPYDCTMDDAPKSALELAMERLKKQDAEQGVTERSLTDEQKNEIADVRKTYGARLAQEEILYKSKTAGYIEPESRRALEENYRRDVERITHERDRKIEKIRERQIESSRRRHERRDRATVSAQPAPSRCTENRPAYATPRAASAPEQATTKNAVNARGMSRKPLIPASEASAAIAPNSSGTA